MGCFMEAFALAAIVSVILFFVFNKKKNKIHSVASYRDRLLKVLEKEDFSKKDKNELEQLAKSLALKPEGKDQAEKIAISDYIKKLTQDDLLNPKKLSEIQHAVNFIGNKEIRLAVTDGRFFNMLTAGWHMEKEKKLQAMPIDAKDNIIQKGETLLWLTEAKVNKFKDDGKHEASLEIVEGTRYKVGSLEMDKAKPYSLLVNDTGTLFLTNKRIIFKGEKSVISINYDQLSSVNVTEAGLALGKKADEQPIYIELPSYEFVCTLIAFILAHPKAEILPPYTLDILQD